MRVAVVGAGVAGLAWPQGERGAAAGYARLVFLVIVTDEAAGDAGELGVANAIEGGRRVGAPQEHPGAALALGLL